MAPSIFAHNAATPKAHFVRFMIIYFCTLLFILPLSVLGEPDEKDANMMEVSFYLADGETPAWADISLTDGVHSYTWTNVHKVSFNMTNAFKGNISWSFKYEIGANSYMMDLLTPNWQKDLSVDFLLQDLATMGRDEVVPILVSDPKDLVLNSTTDNDRIDISMSGAEGDLVVIGIPIDNDLSKAPAVGVTDLTVCGSPEKSADIGIMLSDGKRGSMLLVPFIERPYEELTASVAMEDLDPERSYVSLRKTARDDAITSGELRGENLEPTGYPYPQMFLPPGKDMITLDWQDGQADLPTVTEAGQTLLIDGFAILEQGNTFMAVVAQDSGIGATISPIEILEDEGSATGNVEGDIVGDVWVGFDLKDDESVQEVLINGASAPIWSYVFGDDMTQGVARGRSPFELSIRFQRVVDFEIQGPSEISLKSGESTTTDLDISNNGAGSIDLSLTYSGDPWGTMTGPATVRMKASSQKSVPLHISVSQNTTSERVPINVTAMDEATGIMRSTTFYLDIHEPSRIDFLVNGSERVDIVEGSNGDMDLQISNIGNIPTQFEVMITHDFPGEITYPASLSIDPGEEASINISINNSTGRAAGYNLKVYVSAQGGPTKATSIKLVVLPKDGGGGNNPTSVPVSPLVPGAAVATISIIAFAGFLATETGKYSLFKFTLLFLPMFSRLSKERVLDNFIRGKIFRYIEDNPGKYYSALRDRLKVSNGVLAHHLKTLEREGYIVSRADGHLRRFYPMSIKLPTKEIEGLSWFQIGIIDVIRKNKDIRQKDIAKKMEESKQVINYHLNILSKAGIVTKTKVGREAFYDVDERTIRMLPRVDTKLRDMNLDRKEIPAHNKTTP